MRAARRLQRQPERPPNTEQTQGVRQGSGKAWTLRGSQLRLRRTWLPSCLIKLSLIKVLTPQPRLQRQPTPAWALRGSQLGLRQNWLPSCLIKYLIAQTSDTTATLAKAVATHTAQTQGMKQGSGKAWSRGYVGRRATTSYACLIITSINFSLVKIPTPATTEVSCKQIGIIEGCCVAFLNMLATLALPI